jgi:hypothetical protein
MGDLMTKEIDNSNEIIPKVFEFSIGPVIHPLGFNIKIKNGKIIPADDYLLFPNFDNDFIIPSEEEWMKFWDKMDKIGIWNWIESYYPQDVMVLDGTNWTLKIKLGNKKFESSGSNAYPGENVGEIIDVDKSKSFKKFLNALTSLTGIKIKSMRVKNINRP